jgi:hypothetical protein
VLPFGRKKPPYTGWFCLYTRSLMSSRMRLPPFVSRRAAFRHLGGALLASFYTHYLYLFISYFRCHQIPHNSIASRCCFQFHMHFAAGLPRPAVYFNTSTGYFDIYCLLLLFFEFQHFDKFHYWCINAMDYIIWVIYLFSTSHAVQVYHISPHFSHHA